MSHTNMSPKTRWMYLLNFLRNPPAMNKIAATQKIFQHFGRINFSIHTLSPPTISYPQTLPSSIIFHPNLTQPHPTNLGPSSSPRTRFIKMPGRSKGLAYVEFYLQEATLKALALSGQPIKGQAHHRHGLARHGNVGIREIFRKKTTTWGRKSSSWWISCQNLI